LALGKNKRGKSIEKKLRSWQYKLGKRIRKKYVHGQINMGKRVKKYYIRSRPLRCTSKKSTCVTFSLCGRLRLAYACLWSMDSNPTMRPRTWVSSNTLSTVCGNQGKTVKELNELIKDDIVRLS
jgi:hypothetical protein